VQAVDLVRDAALALEEAITAQAHVYRTVPMAGRTHGVHAEPTTFGAKLATASAWRVPVPGSRSGSSRVRSAPTPTSIPRLRPTCARRSASHRCPRRR
jgi:adenylosuccinate lyase